MKKINNGYDWQYVKIGGVVRVKIEKGRDIAHLAELDQKMWTVLSCPAAGLEFDADTLKMVDTDADGHIHVNDVIKTAQWLCSAIKDHDTLLKGASELSLDNIDDSTDQGKTLLSAARRILSEQGLKKNTISVNEAAKGESTRKYYADCADYVAWFDSADESTRPYGDNTAAAYALYTGLKDKVADYFMRCRLVAYNGSYADAVDVCADRVSSISDKNLALCADEIAAYPLAKPSADGILHFDTINPAWSSKFAEFAGLVGLGGGVASENHATLGTTITGGNPPDPTALSPFQLCSAKSRAGRATAAALLNSHSSSDSETFSEASSASEGNFCTEAEWNAVGASFAQYEAWLGAKKGADVEADGIDKAREALASLTPESDADTAAIRDVNRLLHLFRDFYTLLKNFVIMEDFYSMNPDQKAIFEAGDLFIDQRCCKLCVKVSNMAAHADMPVLSGMFLIYCHCVSRTTGKEMDIVAVLTSGNTKYIRVGKNCIFYDRSGADWDATVTKVVKNPINLREAFWSPYVQFGEFCSNLINKSAEKKNEKVLSDLQESATDVATADGAQKVSAVKQPFDIAKFAGIFAALGMAVGLLADALVGLLKGVMALQLWQLAVLIILIMLVISGPACLIAYRKLRRRNLGPVLNANGWAINSEIKVNVLFGNTLTSSAAYPKLNVKDPFAPKMKWWQQLISYLVAALILAFTVLYFTDKLPKIGINLTRSQVSSTVNSGISSFTNGISNAADAATAEIQNDSTAIQTPIQ